MIDQRLIMVAWVLLGLASAMLLVLSTVYLVQRLLEWKWHTSVRCHVGGCPNNYKGACKAHSITIGSIGVCLGGNKKEDVDAADK